MKATHLHLSFGDQPIYSDCNFHTDPGDKIGIVGVNGAGKTTLFKVILGLQPLDDGHIDLERVRLGYLPQEIIIPDVNTAISNSNLALSPTPTSDTTISKSGSNPTTPTSRLITPAPTSDTTVWDYIASGRPIDALQSQLNAEYEKLAKYPDSAAILARIDELQTTIDSYDLANFDYELLKIVEKMRLDNLINQKMRELSGGQKSKVAFARVLFENAGLLLLDEPTNHLDATTKDFVANFLRNYPGTVLVISHDVDFLNTVTTKTLFINKTTHSMKLYDGNYTAFRRQYAAEQAALNQRISLEEREIKRLAEFVQRAKNAKRSNHAFHQQGLIREKTLIKRLENLETRERPCAHVDLHLTPKIQSTRTPLEVQNLSFAYPNAPAIYDKLSFRLDRGEKFLIVGENGAGKSTLLKLIVGRLTPTSGSVIFGAHTTLAYYAQELELLDPRRTILENVASYDFTDTELRSALSNFLFYGDDVHKSVSVLSPGEKARVALCKVLLERANLIILDEPTNHFDPDTQKVIGENLRDYPGTIIMVSHNPAFVEQIGITRMLIVPPRNPETAATPTKKLSPQKSTPTSKTSPNPHSKPQPSPNQVIIKNYSPELLEYYYYLNSDQF